MARVGFIGIGTMGAPMAGNLVRKGFDVTAFDADGARAARFAAELGCRAATSVSDLAGCSCIVTMLPDGREVQQALLGPQGGALAELARPGSIFIDMSSSEPLLTRATGAILAARGLHLIDAPVSGARPRAESGTLAIMIGCAPGELLERVRPVLAAMGSQLFVLGGLGNGHAMKAINNIIAGSTMVAVAEGLALGEAFGLAPATMVDVLNASTGRSFVTELVAKEHVITDRYATGFALGLLAKDVRIAADLGEEVGMQLPLFTLTRECFQMAREAEGAASDSSRAFIAVRKAATGRKEG